VRDELSFRSFRDGGPTEGGDAELTDREMLAQGGTQRSRSCPNTPNGQRGRSSTAPKSAVRCERKADTCPNDQQHQRPNEELIVPQVIEIIGAGEGNRTLVFSLEGCCSTIELHPRLVGSPTMPERRPQPWRCEWAQPSLTSFLASPHFWPDKTAVPAACRRPGLHTGRGRTYTEGSINNERR
jgi:hypothetical protein